MQNIPTPEESINNLTNGDNVCTDILAKINACISTQTEQKVSFLINKMKTNMLPYLLYCDKKNEIAKPFKEKG